MEEEEDCEKIEMYEEAAPEIFVAPKNRASNKMVVANNLNVTRKFTKNLEDMSKQKLMASGCNASCKSLDFDDVHTSFCGHRQQSAPLRKPAQSIDKGCSTPTQYSRLVCWACFNISSCRADWLTIVVESFECSEDF
jgi:hypothetical protein